MTRPLAQVGLEGAIEMLLLATVILPTVAMLPGADKSVMIALTRGVEHAGEERGGGGV